MSHDEALGIVHSHTATSPDTLLLSGKKLAKTVMLRESERERAQHKMQENVEFKNFSNSLETSFIEADTLESYLCYISTTSPISILYRNCI